MTINRREFTEGAGLVAGGVAVTGALEPAPADSAEQPATRVPVTAIVNGQPRTIAVEPRTTLLDALREQLRRDLPVMAEKLL
jgi:xanthine dehydrogenase YagT iron-sulfur-binding subunit